MRFSATPARLMFVVAAVAVAALAYSTEAAASDGLFRPSPRYDMFYNYYTTPSVYGGQPAQLYISPRPTPPFVGHTYITYQPLLPHEFLYKHFRKYERFNVTDCGSTKTRVCWW